jgi:hypothetical protein
VDEHLAERDQNQNLVVVNNLGKVCQVRVSSDQSEDSPAAQLPMADWVYDFCRTVTHAELEKVLSAAQARWSNGRA